MAHRPSYWSVLWLSVDQLVAWGVLYYTYAVLSLPIATDLGLPRGVMAAALSLTFLVSAALARPVGTVLDRAGSRGIMLAGAGLGAVWFTALGLVRTVTATFLVFAMLGVAQALALYEPAFRAVVDWFPEKHRRSRALLILTSVGGFASTVFLPLATAIATRWGWRATVWMLAVIYAAVTIPVRLILLPASRLGSGGHSPRATAVRGSPATTLLGVGFALQAFAATGVTVHLVWHLVERGASPARASVIAGLAGAAQVPGRLVVTALQGVVRAGHRLPLLFLIQAVALLGFIHGGPALSTGAVVLFGAASGMMTLERAAATVEWFGRDTFGARSGSIVSLALLGRAASPIGVEALRCGGQYAEAFGWLAAVLGAGAATIFTAAHLHQSCTRPAEYDGVLVTRPYS
jgi:MFS family permease